MDIKFIGSGPAAKAIIYYITNYITKSQLKTHVAYAALELAAKKLEEYNPDDDDITVRAKKLLQKCAYSIISHQELSSQQVASYLMDYEDHFTSHEYQNLYWPSFENHINREQPSPECYPSSEKINNLTGTENDPEIESETENFGSDNNTTNADLEAECSDEIEEPVHDNTEIDESNNELSVSVNKSGELIARSTQIADYQLRSEYLQNISVWDFISTLKKSTKSRYKNKKTSTSPSTIEAVELEVDSNELEQEADGIVISEEQEDAEEVGDSLQSDAYYTNSLSLKQRKKELFLFLPQHSESHTHCLVFHEKNKCLIPVPIGPSIPRRDQEKNYARYCRLMLILFKPWRHASDLRENDQKWEEAFKLFQDNCSSHVNKIMDNMQILHECQDSGNDHFSQRRHRGHTGMSRNIFSQTGTKQRIDSNDDFGPVDALVILEHLESVSASTSERISRSKSSVNECLLHADMSGMFDVTHHDDPINHGSTFVNTENKIKEVNLIDLVLEEQWKKEYENRRDQWKRKVATETNKNPGPSTSKNRQHNFEQQMSDGSEFRQASEMGTQNQSILSTEILNQIPATFTESDVDINAMIKEFTLNAEQARAFKIICEHSTGLQNEPLKMYIGGAGGTGKSQVINALKVYFERRGQGRRFRLASYTGVAAKNISGMTVHAALSLNQQKKGKQGKTHRDLIAMWEGVEYFFIDEISMIGCQMLYRISEALIEAKGNSAPFGGINFIVAGDFAQLPPVGETRLYASINTSQTQQATKKGQEVVFGKLLWLSIKTVIILTESMRQVGPENKRLVQILERLREGKCNENDYDLLSSRVLKNIYNINWNDWENTPVIVSENAQKDAINEHAAYAFAQRTNQPLHWYHAIDTHQQIPVTDTALKEHLQNLNSGLTNQRLGKIPLAIGMPVMISQNYDVEGGIVNGCTGILREIRYQCDSEGNRYATSCIVESETITGEPLTTLPPNCAAILQDTTDLNFTHPHSGKRCKIKRTQLPILPAFAMTVTKLKDRH